MLGGCFVSPNYTMSEYDGVSIVDAPDDITALSIAFAAIGPGHLRSTNTTRLYTPRKKAGGVKYSVSQG